ncbi:MAG: NB-ARC domain-containing protein [Caldilineaceae bacterium]
MTVATPDPIPATDLHQTLRLLHVPAKLARAPLLHSPLVMQRQQINPPHSLTQTLCTTLDQLRIQLQQQNKKAADLLLGRFWEGLTAEQMVQRERPEPQSIRRFYQQQEQAILLLAQLWQEAEINLCRPQPTNHFLRHLPTATYTKLFGSEGTIARVAQLLTNPAGPALVALKGIGGIGKTALADGVVRALATMPHDFQDLLWVSAKQEFLTPSGIVRYHNGVEQNGKAYREMGTRVRLEQIFDDLGAKLALPEISQLSLPQKVERLRSPLRSVPHLLVIDNLETVADFQALAPWLGQLSGPSKFLLTCRQAVPSLARVVTIDLDELDKAAAVALAHHIAREKQITDCDGAAIYDLVGGNPLAIILVVSQMRRLPPQEVLAAIRSGEEADLYTYIYRQSWAAISRPAQELLFTLQRAGDSAEWSWLEMVNEAPLATLHAAIAELLDFSLIYLQAAANGHRCYAIHRLTSTFLRTEILGWK